MSGFASLDLTVFNYSKTRESFGLTVDSRCYLLQGVWRYIALRSALVLATTRVKTVREPRLQLHK